MEQLTKNQAVATSQEAVQNQNEPQLRDENAHNDKSVHGVLNPTYQAGLRRDAVQPDIEAERKKRDEIEAGKSYCRRRFGGAPCADKSAHNDKSGHGVLNTTYQAGLRREAVQPDIEAERKKRDEIEAGKSYCSRRFGGATCDDKSAQIYARFDKNDWRIQPAEFYRFHDAEVNTFGYF